MLWLLLLLLLGLCLSDCCYSSCCCTTRHEDELRGKGSPERTVDLCDKQDRRSTLWTLNIKSIIPQLHRLQIWEKKKIIDIM